MWKAFILFVLVFVHIDLRGQGFGDSLDTQSPWIIGLAGHYGFILPHSTAVREIANSRPWGLQADFSKQLVNQNTWDYCNCFPRIGASLAYYNFDNPEILGSSLNAIAFVESFTNYTGKLRGSFKLGMGFSFLNNIYHPTENPQNLFYSSPISAILQLQLRLYYQINRQYNLFLAGSYSHISNGRIRQPNKGINFPTASVGVEYALKPLVFPRWQRKKSIGDLYDKRWFFTAFAFSGLKEVEQLGGNNYAAFGVNAYASRVITKLSAISVGLEWLSDLSVRERVNAGIDESGNPHAFSLMVGHEFLMGRFIFNQQLGAYLEKPFPHVDRIYHRWGLYYHFSKGLIFGINLKAHRHIAELADIRVGYRW